MNYLREAASLKPDICELYIREDGIEVGMFSDEVTKTKHVARPC